MAPPVLVELMGLPGAGKSTLLHGLLAADQRIVRMPILRRRPYTPVLVRHLLATLGTLGRSRALGRQWSRELITLMAYVRALPAVLDERDEFAGATLVFDQGPVYTLMRAPLLDPRLATWHERWFAYWRERLDVVVWLDAPEDVLAERIEARQSHHRLKGVGRAAALAGLRDDRAVYVPTLNRLDGGAGGPRVLRFDSSARAPEAIVSAVLAATHAR